MSRGIIYTAILTVLLAGLHGCTDKSPSPTDVPIITPHAPELTIVSPNTAMPGDTLRIRGVRFSPVQNLNYITIGGTRANTVLSWSDTLVVVVIPDNAVSGMVRLITPDEQSNELAITIVPRPPQMSFLNNVRPILLLNNCILCHGGAAHLDVGTVSQLLLGGDHGPAIIPGNADSSLLVITCLPNPPFGQQMPPGGPFLSDSLIQVIKLWIHQGAADN